LLCPSYIGRATAQAVSRQLPGFDPNSGHVTSVADKVALGKVVSEYFGFPFEFSFHLLFRTHHHISSVAGTIGQIVADVTSVIVVHM
jgi:hypothetical protein